MPKGSSDGSVFYRDEERVFWRGSKSERKTVKVWYARVRYKDADGRSREKKRRADSYARACELKRELQDEVERDLLEPARSPDVTFAEFAARYKAEYMIPPRIVAGKKVAGLRSYKALETFYNPLVAYFGESLLRSITYDDIKEYKALRLDTPVVVKRRERRTGRVWYEERQRSVASVQRELQLARRIFNVALRQVKLAANPFHGGDALIVTAHETKRMRILTHDEEEALLAACGERINVYVRGGKQVTARDKGKRRAHLRPSLVCALDTALRENEQFTITREDVDLDEGVIRVKELNAKVERERLVPITARLRVELEKLLGKAGEEPEARVFPYPDVHRAFENACRAVGIRGIRWHDLRHTAIMRMLEAGVPESEVMRITGHTSYVTFMRYVNMNNERLRHHASLLDAQHARIEEASREKEGRTPVN